MKIYVIIAIVISTFFGLLPIYIGTRFDQAELCDPELLYSAGRTCVPLWDRALIFFAAYFAVAATFFIALALFWKLIMQMSGKQ